MPESQRTTEVRTRFAPSPTGPLHMGGVRTALFNYLFARQNHGAFIVRIEDTDKERSTKEHEEDILEHLEWLGLSWDEGITQEGERGEYGPYRQSDRTELYTSYLERLLEQESAYYCFCTKQQLENQRKEQEGRGEAPRYPGTCRDLSAEQVQEYQKKRKRAVIRFRVPDEEVVFPDMIRGDISFNTNLFGDFVIAKDLQTPLYNFTVVVDDEHMNISHVIRGEDHIPNTPKQILIQRALEFTPPVYGHLPLLLGTDKAKLSKRHGDNSVSAFREAGYLPEAILNFLALLGWNPGTDQETFTPEELLKEFSVERVQKGAAIFDIQKLDWLNGHYIREMEGEKLAYMCAPYLVQEGFLIPLWEDEEKSTDLIGYLGRQLVQRSFRVVATNEEIDIAELEKMIGLYQERLKKLSEITMLIDFFFVKKLEYEKELLFWKDAKEKETLQALEILERLIESIEEGEWSIEKLEEVIMPKAEQMQNRGYLLWPLRVALTGKKASAGPFEIAAVLGKDKTQGRITLAKEKCTL